MSKRKFVGFVLALPSISLFIFVILIPGLWAVILSMSNYALAGSNYRNFEFIFFDNYLNIINDPSFFNSLKVTFLFALATTLLEVLLSLFIVSFTHRANNIVKSLCSIIFLMGTIIPLSVSIHLFISVFHYKYGLLNQLPLLPKVDWFTNHPLGTLILCETWIGVGWVYFLYSAVIESIPNELLELAALDNLSMFGKIRHIYLPQLKNVIFVTILFSLLNGLQEFILVLSLTGGGPNHKTEVISLFAYNRAFRLFDLGYGTAINVILLVLVIVLLLPLVMLCRKAFMRGYYHDKS